VYFKFRVRKFMKLFKSLLVAPATLGLLAPMSATANEVTINDFNPAEELAITNSRVDGLEARLNNFEAGGFSDTTTASFSADAVIGSIDGDPTSEAVQFEYQYNIGLTTSFTGEDSFDVAIDSGSDTPTTAANPMAFDTGAALSVDGVTYSFPVGGISMLVGNDTDISSVFTGACTYSAFTDGFGDCGTANSIGVGGNGVTVAGSYAYDSGFSLAAGLSGTTATVDDAGDTVSPGILTTEGSDTYAIEAAYTADSWAMALAYVSADNGADEETTTWGVNASYTFDDAALPTVSVGWETTETGGVDADGYFVGLTFPEVGPGSVSLGVATLGNFTDDETELMAYEASYAYPVNDSLTVTPGIFIAEQEGDDLTGIMVKSSFSF
jgi:hypothetical protein